MKATMHMFWFSILLFITGGSALAVASPEIEKGDTVQQVVDKLGNPQGKIAGGSRTTYYYERGTVDFVTGRVERVMLVTSQEAKERTAARELAEENHRKLVDAERKRLAEAGEAERARTLADKTFADLPPTEQLQYWTRFSKQYPYTDVRVQVTKAAADVKVAQTISELLTEKIALKKRVDEIEVRFRDLDADYAASLANWKRTEIDDERAKLKEELGTIQARIHELGD